MDPNTNPTLKRWIEISWERLRPQLLLLKARDDINTPKKDIEQMERMIQQGFGAVGNRAFWEGHLPTLLQSTTLDLAQWLPTGYGPVGMNSGTFVPEGA
jgi:hypothetical protein